MVELREAEKGFSGKIFYPFPGFLEIDDWPDKGRNSEIEEEVKRVKELQQDTLISQK